MTAVVILATDRYATHHFYEEFGHMILGRDLVFISDAIRARQILQRFRPVDGLQIVITEDREIRNFQALLDVVIEWAASYEDFVDIRWNWYIDELDRNEFVGESYYYHRDMLTQAAGIMRNINSAALGASGALDHAVRAALEFEDSQNRIQAHFSMDQAGELFQHIQGQMRQFSFTEDEMEEIRLPLVRPSEVEIDIDLDPEQVAELRAYLEMQIDE